jgi:trehalose utilization protein
MSYDMPSLPLSWGNARVNGFLLEDNKRAFTMKTYGKMMCALALVAAAAISLSSCATAAPAQEKKASVKKVVVVWSEGTAPKRVYPNDINGAIADGLKASLKDWEVVTASINDPEQGLPDALLNRCDVLMWWGHKKHDLVKDELVAKIVKRVKDDGMGFISLHSSHFAKANKALMGDACSWGDYKGDSTTLDITVKESTHPIAQGVKDFQIIQSERYKEPYAVPTPEAVPFEGVYTLKGGAKDPVARIGLCWHTGKGKFFYFQAGHETNPTFFDNSVKRIMANAVQWADPASK